MAVTPSGRSMAVTPWATLLLTLGDGHACRRASASIPTDGDGECGAAPDRGGAGNERVGNVDSLSGDEPAGLVFGVDETHEHDQDAVEQWRRDHRGGDVFAPDQRGPECGRDDERDTEGVTAVPASQHRRGADDGSHHKNEDDDAAAGDADAGASGSGWAVDRSGFGHGSTLGRGARPGRSEGAAASPDRAEWDRARRDQPTRRARLARPRPTRARRTRVRAA